MRLSGLRLCQVRVFVEKRDFVFIGYFHFAFASLALEVVDRHEPAPFLDYRVTAVFTFKDEVHVP
jgi:hypothetical protein